MSVYSGPEISNDGLVFAYDMSNPQKSWRGAPTTNLVATVPYTLTAYTACSGPVSIIANDASGQPRTVNRYTITSTGGTPRARITATGLTTGVNYTYSLKIKYNGPIAFPSYYIDSSKGNPEGGTNNNSFTSQNVTITPIGNGWYQLVESFVFSACLTGGSWSNFGLSAPDASYLNQTFDAYDIQFEQQPFITPFVNGTRLNTQSIQDLTNNNTVTATSLTYASDGAFNFNGANSNYLTIGTTNDTALKGTAAYTVTGWINCSTSGPNAYSELYMANSGGLTSSCINIFWYNSTIGFFTGTGFYSYQIAVGALKYNTWYHVTAIIDYTNSVFSVYLNGSYKGQSSFTAYTPGGTVVTIGKNTCTGNSGDYITGRIPTLSVYNRALSAEEIQQNFNATRGRYFGYQQLTYTASSNVTLTNNGTQEVSMFKNTNNGSWNGEVRSTEAFTAPCTIEFSKQSASGDNGVSYAMIGWNEDPILNTSYTSIDHASYPYRSDNYVIYNNGAGVALNIPWNVNKRFYIVYDIDGFIRHYNGSTLLYSANYGTNKTVYVDSSFYSVDSTFGGFTNVKVARSSWNGINYV